MKPSSLVDQLELDRRYRHHKDRDTQREGDHVYRADLRLKDIAVLLGNDWDKLALHLNFTKSDINIIRLKYTNSTLQQSISMLKSWSLGSGNEATGNVIEMALKKINRADIVYQCLFNVALVTDASEKAVAKAVFELAADMGKISPHDQITQRLH